MAAARDPTPQEGFQLISSLLLLAPRGLPLLLPILLAFLFVLALLVFAFLFCSLFFLLKVMREDLESMNNPQGYTPHSKTVQTSCEIRGGRGMYLFAFLLLFLLLF